MKKKVAFALCTALMLCSVSVAALAAEPMTEADTVSTMISAADTLPGISAYPAEVRASEENGVYRLEKVYYASTVHHKNMVNPKLSEIGVGLARGVNGTGDPCWYCVQLFLYDGYSITRVDTPTNK